MEDQKTIRNSKGPSPYFRGEYRHYGRYQWKIKYYGFEADWEIEAAQLMAFGNYDHKTGGLEEIDSLLGRPIKASIQGRSGGWLVVDSELTDAELTRLDRYVESCMESLPEFLKEERAVMTEIQKEADAEKAKREAIEKAAPDVIKAAQDLLEVYFDGTLDVKAQHKLWKRLKAALIKAGSHE